jgi:hypothetical protein
MGIGNSKGLVEAICQKEIVSVQLFSDDTWWNIFAELFEKRHCEIWERGGGITDISENLSAAYSSKIVL